MEAQNYEQQDQAQQDYPEEQAGFPAPQTVDNQVQQSREAQVAGIIQEVEAEIGPYPAQEDFDDYDAYLDAKLTWERERTRLEMRREREASQRPIMLVPPPPPRDPLPPDNLWAERMRADQWKREYLEKAKSRSRAGDARGAAEMEERSRWLEDDLRARGPSLREQTATALEYMTKANQITLLGDESQENSPYWLPGQRIVNEAVHHYNRLPHNRILVPVESEPFGTMKQSRPSNMRYVDLPPEVAKEIKDTVYNSGRTGDPEELFKAIHQALRRTGHHSHLKKTFATAKEVQEVQEAAEEERRVQTKGKSIEKMSQKEYEAMRAKQGVKGGRRVGLEDALKIQRGNI
jgi:hypothetical protein